MKIIKQIFIILLFYMIGETISYGIQQLFRQIFIPGTIIGLILLLIFLITKRIKKEEVEEVGSFLTNNMAFFFIPAAVSVMEYFSILQSTFLKIIIISVISLIVSFFAVAYSVKLVIYLQNKRLENRGEINE
jgi:holin-like protein